MRCVHGHMTATNRSVIENIGTFFCRQYSSMPSRPILYHSDIPDNSRLTHHDCVMLLYIPGIPVLAFGAFLQSPLKPPGLGAQPLFGGWVGSRTKKITILCHPIPSVCFLFVDLRKDGPAYAVRFCKIRRDKIWFAKPDGPSRQNLAQSPTTRAIGWLNRKMAPVYK